MAISEYETPFFLQNYLLLSMLSTALRTVKFHLATDCLPHSITLVVWSRLHLRFRPYRTVPMLLQCLHAAMSDDCCDTGCFATNDGTPNQTMNPLVSVPRRYTAYVMLAT